MRFSAATSTRLVYLLLLGLFLLNGPALAHATCECAPGEVTTTSIQPDSHDHQGHCHCQVDECPVCLLLSAPTLVEDAPPAAAATITSTPAAIAPPLVAAAPIRTIRLRAPPV